MDPFIKKGETGGGGGSGKKSIIYKIKKTL